MGRDDDTRGREGNESPRPPQPTASRAPRLLDQVREAIRYRHYSYRTEQAYVEWARRFVLFHGRRHPRALFVQGRHVLHLPRQDRRRQGGDEP